MTDPSLPTWLTVPELVDVLGLTQSRVRRLIEERALVAVRRDGKLVVPDLFIREGEPVHELKGTIVVLGDSGYSDEEIVEWLLAPNETIGVAPIEALRAGRKTEVRRVAQALAF